MYVCMYVLHSHAKILDSSKTFIDNCANIYNNEDLGVGGNMHI